mmetsp:Transcript_28968/g.54845  ORF Transcript_28968/g.54845 Transcript_28968/m.54845 type:complete len:110 (-) Transcript_28968:17-346(-)
MRLLEGHVERAWKERGCFNDPTQSNPSANKTTDNDDPQNRHRPATSSLITNHHDEHSTLLQPIQPAPAHHNSRFYLAFPIPPLLLRIVHLESTLQNTARLIVTEDATSL